MYRIIDRQADKVIVESDFFSLEQIYDSGQCFRMRKLSQEEKKLKSSIIQAGVETDIGQAGAKKSNDQAGAKKSNDQASAKKSNDQASAKKSNDQAGAEKSFNHDKNEEYLESGLPQYYEVISRDRYLILSQNGKEITFYCDPDEYDEYWLSYFDLDQDYEKYINSVNPNDKYLMEACRTCPGMRILKQDLWEMIVTFLISQQNNIKRIHHCIDMICETYGEYHTSADFYAFPSPEALAVLEDDDLKACNLGYRSKYVVRTAKAVVNGEIDLERIAHAPYKKAKEELLTCFGVGEKVADCICLFALHYLDAFPVDTHIRQAMEEHYKRGFPNRRYKGYRGVIQQYIFYYELHK